MSFRIDSVLVHSGRPLGLTLAFLAAACGGGGGGGGGGSGGATSQSGLDGSLGINTPASSMVEQEPNDTIDQASHAAAVRAGESSMVFGNLSGAANDVTDGFFVTATNRVKVLVDAATDGAPVDIRLYDPIAMQFIRTFSSTSPASQRTFHLKGAAFLVVEATNPNTVNYSLTATGFAVPTPLREKESNDTPAEAEYLGELLLGDAITIQGNVRQDGDVDRYLLGFPEDVDLTLAFSSPSATIVEVSDATSNLFAPDLLNSFASTSVSDNNELQIIEPEVQPVLGMTFIELTVKRAQPGRAVQDARGNDATQGKEPPGPLWKYSLALASNPPDYSPARLASRTLFNALRPVAALTLESQGRRWKRPGSWTRLSSTKPAP